MNVELLLEAYKSDAAVAMIWTLVETFSIAGDVRNHAEMPPERTTAFLLNGLCALPSNPFFREHAMSLLPHVQQAVVRFSIDPQAPPKRALCELAQFVAFIVGGPEHAREFAPRIREAFHAD
jgi:hypothetical protein